MVQPPPITAAQKRALKSRAQTLESTVRIGQSGISEGVIESLHHALDCHELVKVRFADFKEDRKTLAPQLASQTGSALVQIVGNVAVFFRPRPLHRNTNDEGATVANQDL
jgi:RNA-binding protein